MYTKRIKKNKTELLRLSNKSQKKERKTVLLWGLDKEHFGSCGSIFLIIGPEKGQLKLGYPIISVLLKSSWEKVDV